MMKNVRVGWVPSLQPDWDKLPDKEMLFLDDDFTRASAEEKAGFIQKANRVSYWQDAWRRLKSNRVAMVSIAFLIILFVFAFVGPMFYEGDYTTQVRGDENL